MWDPHTFWKLLLTVLMLCPAWGLYPASRVTGASCFEATRIRIGSLPLPNERSFLIFFFFYRVNQVCDWPAIQSLLWSPESTSQRTEQELVSSSVPCRGPDSVSMEDQTMQSGLSFTSPRMWMIMC